jgi:hypothetical protein
MEAMRSLKRRLPGIACHQMIPGARASGNGPGRTRGGGYWLQRGRLQPQHRRFGEVTSRTRHQRPYARASKPRDPFPAPFPPPPASAGPQPPSSAVCLTAARTGAHSQSGQRRPLDTEGSQNRTSVSRYRPARDTDIPSRVARRPTKNRGRRAEAVLRAYIPVDRARSAIATGTPAALRMTGPGDPAARSAAVPSHLVANHMTRAARRTPPSPALPRLPAAVPGPMIEPGWATRGHRVRSPMAARNHDSATGTRWCCPGCQQHAATSACEPAPGRRAPGSDADACRSRAGRAMLRGQIPPTNRQRMIKRPDRLLAIRPLTCTYW